MVKAGYEPIVHEPVAIAIEATRDGYEPIVQEPISSSRRVRFSDDPEDVRVLYDDDYDEEKDAELERAASIMEERLKNERIVKQLRCGLFCFGVWVVAVILFLVFGPPIFQ